MRKYPQLEFDLEKLRGNARAVISRCNAAGICVCGVIKGADGLPEIARTLRAAGAAELGTSRLEQVAKCRAAGVPGPWLLIRIPGLTELPDVVALCDTSLQSEWATLMALEEECLRQNRTHRVIVMTDLGDLREGFWDKDELVDVCRRVEQDLPHVHLAGIGVNLSCYGSTKPTPDKMNELVALAHRVEARIGRSLEVVSGGATSSFTLVHWGTMPAGINHLRIGEGILLGKDLQVDWGIRDMDYLRMDTFTLRAEVVEVKDKPTYPIGELAIDAFGRKPTYVDRGVRRRALLALGRAAEDTAVIMLTGVVANAGLPAGLGAKFEALSFSIFYTAAQYQSREELLRGFGAALVLLLLASGLLVCARLLEARFRRRWQGEA